jgi:hypothetical protein
MLKGFAKAISVSRAWILPFAFLAAIWWVVESSDPFQECVKEIYYNPTTENFEKSISSFSVALDVYRSCLGRFTHDNAEAIIASFTIIIALSTIFLWVATRDLVRGTEKTAQAELRAYVHYNGCRWTSHPEKNMIPSYWRLRPYWINSGNTPTRRLWVYTHYEILDNPLVADYKFIPDENKRRPAMIAPHGEIESESRDFSGDELVAIKQRRKHLYVWGIARYRDVFPNTIEHVTKFCVVADISGHLLETTANPRDILFATHDSHNCADEDCENQNY